MIPRLLKERSDYEKSLRYVSLQDCIISKVTDREILFTHIKNGETYFGKLYYFDNQTSAIINIIMKSVLKYAGFEVNNNIKETIEVLEHLIDEDLSKYLKFPYYLSVDVNNEIYGIVGQNFQETDKEIIFDKIYHELNKSNKYMKIDCYRDSYNKINVVFFNNITKTKKLFRIVFGNDTGHSRFQFFNPDSNKSCHWDHNMSINKLFENIDFVLGIDYISSLELTNVKNVNMN